MSSDFAFYLFSHESDGELLQEITLFSRRFAIARVLGDMMHALICWRLARIACKTQGFRNVRIVCSADRPGRQWNSLFFTRVSHFRCLQSRGIAAKFAISLGIPDDLLMWAPASLSRVTIFLHNRMFFTDDSAKSRNASVAMRIVWFFRAVCNYPSFFAATGWLITISLVFPDDLPPPKQ